MYKLDIEDLNNLISVSKRPNIQRQLQEYKNNLQQLYDQELKSAEKSKEKESGETAEGDASENKDKAKETGAQNINNAYVFTTISKYALDTSSEKFVKIYLTEGLENLKEIDKANIRSKFTKSSFDIYILNWKGKNFRFSCFNLAHEIKEGESYTKATSSGLVIYLRKSGSEYWDSLEKKKSLLGEDSKDKLKNKDPNESLMDMMKEMYQNGDPEMKKMIAEAWTKSHDEMNKKNEDKK